MMDVLALFVGSILFLIVLQYRLQLGKAASQTDYLSSETDAGRIVDENGIPRRQSKPFVHL